MPEPGDLPPLPPPVASQPAAAPVVQRKRVIQIAGNPNYALTPPKNSLVQEFATFPHILLSEMEFPEGKIRLNYGEHHVKSRYRPAYGFGLVHIWKGRFPQTASAEDAKPRVLELLNKIVTARADILYEYDGSMKCAIFRSTAGLVIVEHRTEGPNGPSFYSIVTAIPHAQAKGIKIGTL